MGATLVGTIVNALAHHGVAADPKEAVANVATVVNGSGAASNPGQWLSEKIEEITRRLADEGP